MNEIEDADADLDTSSPGLAPATDADLLARVGLILEALLLAADGPLPLEQLHRLVGAEFGIDKRSLREALTRLGERHAQSACELKETAGGWRLQTRAELGEWVARLWQEKPPKYSRAALETLALIVYRQPVTRGEIEDVRGVVVSANILRTLSDRGWVREVGVKEAPGRPALYGTTPQFLDDFNLKSLDQLPALPDVKDLDRLEAALKRLGGEALAEVSSEPESAEALQAVGDTQAAEHGAQDVAHESAPAGEAAADAASEASVEAPPDATHEG